MNKTATRLNPAKLLTQLANSNSSGCLKIEGAVSWNIYVQQGSLQYVYCSVQTLEQLKYHLHYLGWKQAIAALKQCPPSLIQIQNKSAEQNIYGQVISWLLSEKHIDLKQAETLIKSISKDEIYSYFWLNQGSPEWHDRHSIPLWIPLQITEHLSQSISECFNEAETRLNQWQSCSVELLSVHQRPYFAPGWETKPISDSGSLNRQTLIELTKVLRGRTSIRELSTLLKKDELQVAQILSPYIDKKIIYLHHAPSPLDLLPIIPRAEITPPLTADNPQPKTKTWKIVCIDDSPTILSEIQRFLEHDKFEVTAIDDPIQAVSQIFKIDPDLILLDITMPRINGYKLCGLLRSSGKCDRTPIIMVTGNTGLIDKARAKIAGATDYLTKPFTREGLNLVVDKHLQ